MKVKEADHTRKADKDQGEVEVEMERSLMEEGRNREPPAQEQSTCVVRGRPATAASRKERSKTITDLIRGFNAMANAEHLSGGMNQSETPEVEGVAKQTMTKKRKACDEMEQQEVERKVVKK